MRADAGIAEGGKFRATLLDADMADVPTTAAEVLTSFSRRFALARIDSF